ncbi:HTH-type transcriptional repressor NagR [Paenibacillus sp. CECT 9249]|uniref:GntR family transcriptional regulator n=1 Tax=Paenibacillus sp. CECT 9249 TaxID=2845385 RepID=UPI001E32EF6A|nr:GntR family transcriptional regulator [Paenibacillus sp. CECT 9249]CAH0119238.1 HTH-type transcriptional repressor NagR [Paenibacillus sp. CECT 9249]
MLDKKNPLSLYIQMKQIIMNKINDGEWKVGDKIPSETELCEQYNISRITARRAMTELEHEGLIERKPGKGTFVKFAGISQELSKFYSFTEEMKIRGFTPSSKLIDIEVVYPDEEIRTALSMDIQEKVYLIKRLRLANGEIIVIDRSYLPCKLFPELEQYDFEQHSLYQTLQEQYGIVANVAEETIDAILINKENADLLEINKNTPGLLIKRVTYSDETPIEFNHRIVNRDKYKYKVVLR